MKQLPMIVMLVMLSVGSVFAQSDNDFLDADQAEMVSEKGYFAVRWINDTSEPMELFISTYDPEWEPPYNMLPPHLATHIEEKDGWHHTHHRLLPGYFTISFVYSENVYWFAASAENFWGEGDSYYSFPKQILDLDDGHTVPFTHDALESGPGSQTTIHITDSDASDQVKTVKFDNDTEDDLILYLRYTDENDESRERFVSLDAYDDFTISVNRKYSNMYWSALTEDSDYHDYKGWGQDYEWRQSESKRDFLKRIDRELELPRALRFNHVPFIMTLNY